MKRYTVKVNGDEYKVSVEKIGEGVYKVKIGNKTAQVVVEQDAQIKRSENVSARVERIQKVDRKVDKIKRELPENAVTAMLPGTVLKILVSEGEEVKAGQALLILEAMKMENEIVSPKDGIVKEIKVKEGAKVETGETLMVIE